MNEILIEKKEDIIKIFFLKDKDEHMIPTQKLNTHCRSQVNAISSLYAFELTHASIRTFEGCNVAWFTGFTKKIF